MEEVQQQPPLVIGLVVFEQLWSLPANLVMLIAILRMLVRKDSRWWPMQTSDLLILNMNITDFMSTFTYTWALGSTNSQIGNAGPEVCEAVAFFVGTMATVSIGVVCLLGFVRYRMVAHNQRFTTKDTAKMLAALWAFGISYGIFTLAAGLPRLSPSGLYCLGDMRRTNVLSTLNAISGIGISVPPLFVLVFAYARIVLISHEAAEASGHGKKTAKRNRSLNRLAVAIILVYFCTIIPWACTVFFNVITDRDVSREVDTAAGLIIFLNWMLNPVLYAVFQSKYRDALRELFGLKSKNRSTATDSVERKGSMTSDTTATASCVSVKRASTPRHDFPSPSGATSMSDGSSPQLSPAARPRMYSANSFGSVRQAHTPKRVATVSTETFHGQPSPPPIALTPVALTRQLTPRSLRRNTLMYGQTDVDGGHDIVTPPTPTSKIGAEIV